MERVEPRAGGQLANPWTKITTGAQTVEQHVQRENESTHQPRKASTQTAVNKGRPCPESCNIVRAPVSVKMNVLRLELDIGQPHQL
jgi:hypothetical protein